MKNENKKENEAGIEIKLEKIKFVGDISSKHNN